MDHLFVMLNNCFRYVCCMPASCLFHIGIVDQWIYLRVSMPHLIVLWTGNSCDQLVRMRPDDGLDDIWLSTCGIPDDDSMTSTTDSIDWSHLKTGITTHDGVWLSFWHISVALLLLWCFLRGDLKEHLLLLFYSCIWRVSCGLLLIMQNYMLSLLKYIFLVHL